MEKKRTYTAIDFARYHTGNMEAKEMHALEKAALDDPFLADALEGYMHTDSATEDVDHLKSLLAEKTSPKKVYSIASVSQNVWWRVAAIFILIGIAGYFFFDLGLKEDTTLAKNEINELNQKARQAPALDSPATAMMLDNRESDEHTLAAPEIKKDEITGSISQLQHKNMHTQKPLSAPLSENFSLQKKIEDTAFSMNDDLVVSGIDLPVPENQKAIARIKVEDKNKPAVLSMAKEDSPMMAFQRSETIARSINKKEAELSEIAVANNARNRQASAKSNQTILSGRVSGVIITPQSKLQPIEGLENFRHYISRNKEEIRDANKQLLRGSILLEFSINKDGKPVDIRVQKSDCSLCESQAIYLLENGPLWKGDLDKKGEVTILF